MREIWFGFVIALGLMAALPAAAQPAQPNAGALALTKQDRILGKPDAPITIIEYASLTCPHCAHFENDVLPKIKQDWIDTGKAKLVLRDFPLDEAAMRAEMVARCAVPPDRYYPLVETLFASQQEWVLAKDWKAALQKIAQLAGVSKQKFDACFNDQALENEVAGSRLAASQQLGVDSTPTFFINGKKYQGEPTVEAFNQELAAAAKS
jgi:protein-disulfide isomerase